MKKFNFKSNNYYYQLTTRILGIIITIGIAIIFLAIVKVALFILFKM